MHAAQRVELGDLLHLVAEELDAHGALLLVGGEDLHGVAAHAEGAAVEVDVVALVLALHQLAHAACRGRAPRPRSRVTAMSTYERAVPRP